jgi:hypothetical protein
MRTLPCFVVLCPLRTAALAVSIAALAVFGCSSTSGTQSASDSGGLNDAANDGGPGADASVDAADGSPGVDGGPDVVDGSGDAFDGGEGGSFVDGGDGGNGCTVSGGTVATAQCCTSASDFPSNCVVGACGCSPSNSHSVQICNCPVGKCFNGSACQ